MVAVRIFYSVDEEAVEIPLAEEPEAHPELLRQMAEDGQDLYGSLRVRCDGEEIVLEDVLIVLLSTLVLRGMPQLARRRKLTVLHWYWDGNIALELEGDQLRITSGEGDVLSVPFDPFLRLAWQAAVRFEVWTSAVDNPYLPPYREHLQAFETWIEETGRRARWESGG